MPESEGTFDAFISYSSTDKDLAFRLLEKLEGRNFKCWIAPRNVRAGYPFPSEILRGIERSRCFLVVHSNAANASNHVKNEVKHAFDENKVIIPIRVEDVEFTSELSYFLSAKHRIDAWNYRLNDYIEDIVHSISGADFPSPRQPPKKLRIPIWVWAVVGSSGAVFAIFLIFFLIQKSMVTRQVEEIPEVLREVSATSLSILDEFPQQLDLSFSMDSRTNFYSVQLNFTPQMYFSGNIFYSTDGRNFEQLSNSRYPVQLKTLPEGRRFHVKLVSRTGKEKLFEKTVHWVEEFKQAVRVQNIELLGRMFRLTPFTIGLRIDSMTRNSAGSAVEGIEYKYGEDAPVYTFRTHAPDAEKDALGLYSSAKFLTGPYPFREGVDQLFFRYQLYDGSYGEWTQTERLETRDYLVEIEPEEGILPNNDLHPIVYAYVKTVNYRPDYNSFHLRIWPPTNSRKIHYDYEGKGFLSPINPGAQIGLTARDGVLTHRAQNFDRVPVDNQRPSPVQVDLSSHLAIESIRLKFEDAAGSQTPVYTYPWKKQIPHLFEYFEHKQFKADQDIQFFNSVTGPTVPKYEDFPDRNAYYEARNQYSAALTALRNERDQQEDWMYKFRKQRPLREDQS